MNSLFKNMDWNLLREQKDVLLGFIEKRERAIETLEALTALGSGNDDESESNIVNAKKEVEALTGLLHLVDAVQDTAVDEVGLADESVFGKREE